MHDEPEGGGASSYLDCDDPLGAAAPNCPVDLVPMEIVGEGERVRWECPECGLVRL